MAGDGSVGPAGRDVQWCLEVSQAIQEEQMLHVFVQAGKKEDFGLHTMFSHTIKQICRTSMHAQTHASLMSHLADTT